MIANSKFISRESTPDLDVFAIDVAYCGANGFHLVLRSASPHAKGGFDYRHMKVQMTHSEMLSVFASVNGAITAALKASCKAVSQ